MTFKFDKDHSGVKIKTLDEFFAKSERIRIVSTKNRPDIPVNIKTSILMQHYGTKH